MKFKFPVGFAIGLGLVALVVSGILLMQRGARIGLTGSILKVRTTQLDDSSSIAVVDFRFSNPGNVTFMVRGVTVVMEEKDGKQYDGRTVSEMDAKRLFEGLPILGEKFTNTLVERDKILGHTSQDRMVATRFDAPEARLEGRKRFLLRIEEVDGSVTELSER